jgi:hypothetical protein
MLTIDQVIEYLEKTIAEEFLVGDKVGLKRAQTASGVMMSAAESVHDRETAQRFRIVAARAANKLEELNEQGG